MKLDEADGLQRYGRDDGREWHAKLARHLDDRIAARERAALAHSVNA